MPVSAHPPEAIWGQLPPEGTVKPPPYPDRPQLFDEVNWGDYPTQKDSQLAYRLWSLPDSVLEEELAEDPHPFPRPSTQDEAEHRVTFDVLAYNVYEHLMRDHRMPKADNEWDENAQMKISHDGRTMIGWSRGDIFDVPGNEQPAAANEEADARVVVNGHEVLKGKYWVVSRLKEELQRRGLDVTGKASELRKRLYDDERRASSGVRLLPRTDLSSWGIFRQEDYMLKLTRNSRLTPLDMYTWAILLCPYNPTYWVSRSYLFYQMGYLDLALGDAYRAQLLCEILCDPFSRNLQPGLYPRVWHSVEQHVLHTPWKVGQPPMAIMHMRGANGINYFVPTLRKALHNIISLSLKSLQCWTDYQNSEGYLPQRVIMPARDNWAFEKRYNLAANRVLRRQRRQQCSAALFFYETRAGSVSGQRYPYSARDVDRTSPPFLAKLNDEFVAHSQTPRKRIEVRAKEGASGELAVYATEDIHKGDVIYADEPSMRGHLNVSRQADAQQGAPTFPQLCENCRCVVGRPPEGFAPSRTQKIVNREDEDFCECLTLQHTGEPVVFCRLKNRKCLKIAREQYHGRVCGKNWAWLHDAMRPSWNRHRAGPNPHPSYLSHHNEVHGTTLSLILREIFDVTLLRRERTKSPHLLAHELDELLPLQSEEQWEHDRFPFTMAANIRIPFDILLHLGVNVFRDLTFDTWVIQMVLRKLLLSVVPWDRCRRGHGDTMEREDHKAFKPMEQQTGDMDEHDSSFHNLYLFPGLAMFNHTCAEDGNAEWAYGDLVPNRVIVWARHDISAGEEITLGYRANQLSRTEALRLHGRECGCTRCRANPPKPGSHSGEESDPDDDTPPKKKARTMSKQEMDKRRERQAAKKAQRRDDGGKDAGAGPEKSTDVTNRNAMLRFQGPKRLSTPLRQEVNT
jgi:hypothetical protein